MPLRPYLLLYRTRILYAAVLALVSALFILFWTTAEYPTDFGILWHHFCGCPPEPGDTSALLNMPAFVCSVIGLLFGVGVGTGLGGTNPAFGAALHAARTGFHLTRPATRRMVLLTPAILAATVIATFPAAAMLFLLGWLRLVHAPALGHLIDLIRIIPGPAPAALGPHPSLAAVLAASHFGYHYLASVSLGLCAYTLFYAPQWTALSKYGWVRLTSLLLFLIGVLPSMGFFSGFVRSFIFLTSPHPLGRALDYLPPASFVAAHFAFAAAVLYGCWTIAREAEV